MLWFYEFLIWAPCKNVSNNGLGFHRNEKNKKAKALPCVWKDRDGCHHSQIFIPQGISFAQWPTEALEIFAFTGQGGGKVCCKNGEQ